MKSGVKQLEFNRKHAMLWLENANWMSVWTKVKMRVEMRAELPIN